MEKDLVIAGERLSMSNSWIVNVPTLEDEHPWGV